MWEAHQRDCGSVLTYVMSHDGQKKSKSYATPSLQAQTDKLILGHLVQEKVHKHLRILQSCFIKDNHSMFLKIHHILSAIAICPGRNRTLNLPFNLDSFIGWVPPLCTLILLYIYTLPTILPFQIKIAMKNFTVYCCTYVPQVISNGEFFGDLIQSFIKFTPFRKNI